MSQDAQQRRYARRKSLAGLAAVSIAVGAAVIRAASPSLTDQTPTPPPLLTIAPANSTVRPQLTAQFRITPRERATPVPLTLGAREKGWREFEAEFGIKQQNSSPFFGALQLAKYAMDEATFSADQFLKSLGSALEFEYRGGSWKYRAGDGENKPGRHTRSPFENTKFKFDVAFQDGSPYLGMRIIVPFGR